MIIYDGSGLIMGRLASQAAKDALLGKEVHIINCEKVLISGKRENTISRQLTRRLRTGYPLKSQHHSRLPERVVRRAVRGMLPWKISRGRAAFKLVMCHRGAPASLSGHQSLPIPGTHSSKLPNLKYITVGKLCSAIGGKR